MDPLLDIARRHGLFFVEDAAEAHGAEYKGRRVGRLGDLATFSFYGNKIIATGEGGMVVTDDAALARKMLQLKGQGQDFERRYWFPVLGYNYRMTNIQAALGLAQLEKVDWHLARRREIAGWYQELLGGHPLLALQPEKPWARNVYWMNSVVLVGGFPLDRDGTMQRLAAEGIETRPFFYPMHTLPIYCSLAEGQAFPVAESLAARGMNLPSSAGLTYEDVAHVAERLIALGRSREQGF
jgi:perosamine synthetase